MCQQIPLNRGTSGYALVSDEDYAYLAQFNWTLDKNGYVIRMESKIVNERRVRRKVLMHREIMGEPKGKKVDHRFRNKLDNRRDMLRIATQGQNNANSPGRCDKRMSAFKGVYLHKSGTWRALIEIDGLKRHLGVFDHEEDAGKAYDIAALEAWGEFAWLNFPHLRCLYQLTLSLSHIWRARPRVVCLKQ